MEPEPSVLREILLLISVWSLVQLKCEQIILIKPQVSTRKLVLIKYFFYKIVLVNYFFAIYKNVLEFWICF